MMPKYGEQPTAELVKLAQRELHGDSVLSDDASFARLASLRVLPGRLGVTAPLGSAAAVVYDGVLAATVWLPAYGNALAFGVAAGCLGAKGHVEGLEATLILLSHGS